MLVELTSRQKELQTEFREYSDRSIVPRAEQFDQEQRLPGPLIRELGNTGYLGATIPQSFGGLNMDMITFGLLNQELGRGCSSVRTMVTVQNMVGYAVNKWGTQEQKQRWLGGMVTGENIAAFALTEPEIGSDARNVQTAAVLTGDSYILNGKKRWISFGQIAGLFLVFAQLDGQPCAFMLERDTPGLSIEPVLNMLGTRASMIADLTLENCQVPRENLVGRVGFGFVPVALSALGLGRYSIAWGCVGIIEGCLQASVDHSSSRKQFGLLIKEHQLIQEMIANMIVNLKSARLLCLQAGQMEDKGHPDALMEVMAAKYFASRAAVQASSDAVQIQGALGCSTESPTQRYFRDAKIMEIIEGTTQIHQIKIAEYWIGRLGRS